MEGWRLSQFMNSALDKLENGLLRSGVILRDSTELRDVVIEIGQLYEHYKHEAKEPPNYDDEDSF